MPFNKVCIGCGKHFVHEDKRQKYCCKQCLHQHFPHHRIIVECKYCGNPTEIYPSRDDGRLHFCSKICMDSWQKTSRPPSTGKKRLAKICIVCHRTFKPEKKSTKCCSNGCRMQLLHEKQKRETHPSWRGGTTIGRRLLERTTKYQNWRLSVFKRDKYRCVLCGSSKDIQAHHIKPLSLYPKLSTRVSNGATLCKECHLKTYAKEDQFEKYINSALHLIKDAQGREPRIMVMYA